MPTFYITNGDDSINLIEVRRHHALAPGIDGLGNIAVRTHAFDAPVRSAQALRFNERWALVIADECTDGLGERVQRLIKMFRRSWQRTNKLRYVKDIYLVEQSSKESNGRYAKVWSVPELNFPHPVFNTVFEQMTAIANFGISIERGIWRSGAPGALPNVITLDETDGPANPTQAIFSNYQDDHSVDIIWRYEDGVGYTFLMQLADGELGNTTDFDAVTPAWDGEAGERADFDAIADIDGDLNDTAAAAHDGAVGLEITFDNATAAYGALNADIVDNETGVATFWFNDNDLILSNNGQIRICEFLDGTPLARWRIAILNTAGILQIRASAMDDGGAWDNGAWVDLGPLGTVGWTRVDFLFKRSSIDGANNGMNRLDINAVLADLQDDIDNDTRDWDFVRLCMIWTNSTVFGGSFYMDSMRIDPLGTLFADKLAAMDGIYGYAVPVITNTSRQGHLNGPNNETEFGAECWVRPTLAMAAGESFSIIRTAGVGTPFRITLNFDGTNYLIGYEQVTDTGVNINLGTIVTDEPHFVGVWWGAATGPGANNGFIYLYIDGVLTEWENDTDNDTRNIDSVRFGAAEGLDGNTLGIFDVDECRWWVPGADMFPNPASVNDAFYVGSDEPYWVVPWNITVAGIYSGVTFVYEYSDGGAGWPALTLGDDLMLYPDDDPFATAGIAAMHAYPGSDWATENVNGRVKYWIRIRITAISTWITSPQCDYVYNQKTPEVRIPLASLRGDVPPFVLKRLKSADGGDEDNTMCSMSRIIAGVKSTAGGNDLDNFHSRLNCGGDGLPAGWTVTYGSDTSSVADVQAPGGDRAECTFATVAIQAMRVRFKGENKLRDYAGEYRVFLRYNQDTGDPGDIALKLRVRIDSTDAFAPAFETREVSSAGAYDHVLIDMIPGDTLLLPLLEIVNADDLDADLIFEIWAEVVTGTADLGLLDLIFIPADEWIGDLNDPITDATSGTSALRGLNVLDVDSGILDNRTIRQIIDGSEITPVETWSRRSSPIEIEPGLDARLYYLIGYYTDGWGDGPFLAENMQGFLAELYAQACYFYLRGAD